MEIARVQAKGQRYRKKEVTTIFRCKTAGAAILYRYKEDIVIRKIAIKKLHCTSHLPSSVLRSLWLERFHELSNLIFRIPSEQDLDDIATSQAGGKLTGPFVRLYKQQWVPISTK